jgi:CubicO group peptidase (beta-lactamase class C family)
MFERVMALTDSFLEMGVPGNDLAIWQDGQCIFRRWNGFQDLEKTMPMTGQERYNIYSCSKPITCTAAMQLWEKGLFSLEDRLSDYLPEFAEMNVETEEGIKKAEKPILIRHLFEMTAGLNYNTSSPSIQLAQAQTDGRCPTRETMKYIAREPLSSEPGAQWRYSLCHDVLAAVVEVISGVRFSEYLKKNIFDPLGMNRTTFLLPKEELSTIAPQYRAAGENKESVWCGPEIYRFKLGSEYESGGAGGISCVDDYMKFLEAMRVGDVILGKDTIAMMATDRLTPEQKQTFSRKPYGYGLGVQCPPKEGAGRITRFGWGGAAGALLGVDPRRNMVFYYVQHVFGSRMDSMKEQIYRAIIDDMDT